MAVRRPTRRFFHCFVGDVRIGQNHNGHRTSEGCKLIGDVPLELVVPHPTNNFEVFEPTHPEGQGLRIFPRITLVFLNQPTSEGGGVGFPVADQGCPSLASVLGLSFVSTSFAIINIKFSVFVVIVI